jgi:hypothetical protein
MPALKFAAHYAPFAALVPVTAVDALDPTTRRYLAAVEGMSAAECEMLSKPWRLDHDASRALTQAVAKNRRLNIEETVALSALSTIPATLSGDAGWAAVRTAVHGGRVLSRRSELSSDELLALWAPLEPAIPFKSLGGARRKPADAAARGLAASAPR